MSAVLETTNFPQVASKGEGYATVEARMDTLLPGQLAKEGCSGLGRRSRAEQILNDLPLSLMVLQSDRRIVFVNRCAERLFAQSNALCLANRLMSIGQVQAPQLEGLLRQASTGSSAQAGLWLSREPQIGWVSVSGVTASIAVNAEWPAHCLLLTVQVDQPSLSQDARIDALCRQCGLTRTERYVLLLLADGLAVDEAARQLGLRVSTLRTHVRNLLGKTHAPSLMRLTRWLGSAAPMLD